MVLDKYDRILKLIVAIVALLSSCYLVGLFDPGVLGNDFAQIISVARNLLAGNGLRTSLIYYDVHYALGAAPVPQTVFPPGLAVVVAPLLALGISPEWAVFVLCAVAWLTSGVLLFRSMQLANCPTSVTSLITATWFVVAVNWSTVLQCRSEPALTALTCFGLYATAKWETVEKNKRYWLFGLGLVAGAGVLIRYQGLFFVAAVGLFFLLRYLGDLTVDRLKDLAVVVIAPLIIVVTVVLYNHNVTASVSGGPLSNVYYRSSISEVLYGFYYAFSEILGVSATRLLNGGISEVLLLSSVVCLIWTGWRTGIHRIVFRMASASGGLRISICYVLVSLAAFFYLSSMRSMDYAQERFFSTLVPFIMYFFAFVARGLTESVDMPKTVTWLSVLFFVGSVSVGQLRAIDEQLEETASDTRLAEIREALSTGYHRTTLRKFLQDETDRGSNVTGHESQLTGHVLERATFGFTPPKFTSRIFDVDEVGAMATNLNMKYLIFYPQLYDGNAYQNSNRILLTELSSGNVPRWLTLLVESSRVQLYEIDLEHVSSEH